MKKFLLSLIITTFLFTVSSFATIYGKEPASVNTEISFVSDGSTKIETGKPVETGDYNGISFIAISGMLISSASLIFIILLYKRNKKNSM